MAYGIVYTGSSDHKLYAFSAAGTTNCSGTPKVCLPLWTGTTSKSPHFEQSFSEDGGKTWEVNWITDQVRVE